MMAIKSRAPAAMSASATMLRLANASNATTLEVGTTRASMSMSTLMMTLPPTRKWYPPGPKEGALAPTRARTAKYARKTEIYGSDITRDLVEKTRKDDQIGRAPVWTPVTSGY